jgi:hypothetical protein
MKVLKAIKQAQLLAQELKRLATILHRRCGISHRKAEPSTLDRLSALDPELALLQKLGWS